MVNRGAFQGVRYRFLQDQKPLYAQAVLSNNTADITVDIQRRFFKRFPLEMDEVEEPSEEFLSAVDDNASDPEPPAPNEETLSPEAYELAIHTFQVRGELVTYRRKVSILVATNNSKLTFDAANPTLADVPAIQGSPFFPKRILSLQRYIWPSSLETQRETHCEAEATDTLQPLGKGQCRRDRIRDQNLSRARGVSRKRG